MYRQPRPAAPPVRCKGLNSYRAFAGANERDLTLPDLDLDTGRAWLADFVERGRKPATVDAGARALRVFSHWIVADDYARADPLAKLQVPKVPTTIVETFSTLQILDLIDAAPKPSRWSSKSSTTRDPTRRDCQAAKQ